MNVTAKCLCGDEHLIPETGRVWFLHPDSGALAQDLLRRGEIVVPCPLVPRQQAQNVDAQIALKYMGSMKVSQIVEGR